MEKKAPRFSGLSIMWALHDETMNRVEKAIELLEKHESDEKEISTALGKLFFAMFGLKLKEELILFPAALEIIDDEEWGKMHLQSLEYGFPFIEKPELKAFEKEKLSEIHDYIKDFNLGYLFKTDTGSLNFEQLLAVFNFLPIDITIVDENEIVAFFNRPKDRIFPRSPAVWPGC